MRSDLYFTPLYRIPAVSSCDDFDMYSDTKFHRDKKKNCAENHELRIDIDRQVNSELARETRAIKSNSRLNKTQCPREFGTRMRCPKQRSIPLGTYRPFFGIGCVTATSLIAAMKEQGLPAKTRPASSKDDLNYAIGLNRLLLVPFGVWPLNENPTGLEAVTKRIRLLVTISIILLHVIPQYCYVLSEPVSEVFLQIVPEHVIYLLTITKLVIYVVYSDKIRYCVARIENDWNNVKLVEDREIMMNMAKLGRFMTICCVSSTYSGGFFYTAILPFLKDTESRMRENVSLVERPLPFRITYIFLDEQTTPVYEITWIIQFLGMSSMCVLGCGTYALIGVFVGHACGQLRVIGTRLEKLGDDHAAELHIVQRKIAETVQHHLRVIRYIASVNESLQMLFLTEELGTLTVICFVGYLLLSAWNDINSRLFTILFFVILSAFTFNYFIISIVGQQLWDESEAIGVAASRVEWYRLPPKVSRSLIVYMIRSTRPLKLSACNMFDMSLQNFADVLRGAYILLNVVRKITEVD